MANKCSCEKLRKEVAQLKKRLESGKGMTVEHTEVKGINSHGHLIFGKSKTLTARE